MRFAVLYGSTREKREGIKAARFLVNQLQARGHEVDLLDVLELGVPMMERMFKAYEEGTAPAVLEHIHKVLIAAEGFVFVGGEWNHSVPGPLKNMIDHFQKEYFFKPAGIATYSAGPFGGARASVHYRAILGELGMPTLSTMLAISKVQSSFDDAGNDVTEKKDHERRSLRFLDELEWYTDALNHKRSKDGTPY